MTMAIAGRVATYKNRKGTSASQTQTQKQQKQKPPSSQQQQQQQQLKKSKQTQESKPQAMQQQQIQQQQLVLQELQQKRRPVKRINWWKEASLFTELAVPTVLLSVGFCVSPVLTASTVGRKFGATHLSGFTLANLTGNIGTLSVLQGFFTAADTLTPQAFAAGNSKEVGFIALRGIASNSFALAILCGILVPYVDRILTACHQDEIAVQYATSWFRIYVLGLPWYVFYNVTWKYLSAQHIMQPLVIALVLSSVLLVVILDPWTDWFGYNGSAYAFSFYQLFQAVSLWILVYIDKDKYDTLGSTFPEFWDIAEWKLALFDNWGNYQEFLILGMGGVFAQSEWLYWEAQGLIIGTLGVIPLSIHTIPTQIIVVLFMIPLGFGVALAIRMGATLIQTNGVTKTKKIVVGALCVTTVILIMISIIMYAFRYTIYAMFTTDEVVVQGAESIWWKVCLFQYSSGMFAILSGVATGLGMQWTLALVTCSCLFGFGVPATYYFAITRQGGLSSAWTWINAPYILMIVWLCFEFSRTDWHSIRQQILEREQVEDDSDDEEEGEIATDKHSLLENVELTSTSLKYGTVDMK